MEGLISAIAYQEAYDRVVKDLRSLERTMVEVEKELSTTLDQKKRRVLQYSLKKAIETREFVLQELERCKRVTKSISEVNS